MSAPERASSELDSYLQTAFPVSAYEVRCIQRQRWGDGTETCSDASQATSNASALQHLTSRVGALVTSIPRDVTNTCAAPSVDQYASPALRLIAVVRQLYTGQVQQSVCLRSARHARRLRTPQLRPAASPNPAVSLCGAAQDIHGESYERCNPRAAHATAAEGRASRQSVLDGWVGSGGGRRG